MTTSFESHEVPMFSESVYLGDGESFFGVSFWDRKKLSFGFKHMGFNEYQGYSCPKVPEPVKREVWLYTTSLIIGFMRSQEREWNAINSWKLKNGDSVRVVAGRKVPKGTTGVIFWQGENQWGKSVGIRTSDRKDTRGRWADVHFVKPSYLELLKEREYVKLTMQAVNDIIRSFENWHMSSKGKEYLREHVEKNVYHWLGRIEENM